MLCRNPMPRADDAALEQRECRLDCVGMDFAVNVDLGFVLDGLVFGGQTGSLHRRGISIEFIRHDHVYIFAHVFADVLRECSALGIVRMKEAGFTPTLAKANDDLLFAIRVSGLVLMAALDSTDVGFIPFDRAVQHRLFRRCHCRPDAVTEIPCRLVADSEGPLDLVGAHALAGFAQKVDSCKPLDERQMGIVEDAVSENGELIIAVFAVENFGGIDEPYNRPFAARAFWLIRPAEPLQKFPAKIVIGERVAKLDNGHRRLLRG